MNLVALVKFYTQCLITLWKLLLSEENILLNVACIRVRIWFCSYLEEFLPVASVKEETDSVSWKKGNKWQWRYIFFFSILRVFRYWSRVPRESVRYLLFVGYSKLDWTKHWTSWSSWMCFAQGFGLHDLTELPYNLNYFVILSE